MLTAVLSLLALAAPIADPLPTTLPHYQGAPATARPLAASKAPRNPHLAKDPRSNIHNDTWMTDAYAYAGPLGNSPRAFSNAMTPALCGSLTFHSQGYIVSVCPSVGVPPQARVIDPVSLEVLATYDMPTAPDPPGTRRTRTTPAGATSSSTTRTASGAPRRRATCSCSRSQQTAAASPRSATTT